VLPREILNEDLYCIVIGINPSLTTELNELALQLLSGLQQSSLADLCFSS
jgi:hypothetical protein